MALPPVLLFSLSVYATPKDDDDQVENTETIEDKNYEKVRTFQGTNEEKKRRWKAFRRTLSHNSKYLRLVNTMDSILEKEARWQRFLKEEHEAEALRVRNANRSDRIPQNGKKRSWLRCALGQTWDGSVCVGTPKSFTWERATRACPERFRLPNVREFAELLCTYNLEKVLYWVKRGDIFMPSMCPSCVRNEVCASMFGADHGLYWSKNQPRKKCGENCKKRAYAAVFQANGAYSDIKDYDKEDMYYVRCIKR